MKLRTSERKQAKIKMALQGPSGTGKSLSALLLAKGLINDNLDKIAVIDTENGSSNIYSHVGNYNVLNIQLPHTPERYIEAIDVCLAANMEVIIIDSISHCWEELLDYHRKLTGNSFTNWSKVTPRHNSLINKILQSPAHFIVTIRTKQDYILNNINGKLVPEKVGLKPIQREGLDYEFTLVFNINSKHFATASKDRTNLFNGKPEFMINSSTGRKILEWCNAPSSEEDVLKRINECLSLSELMKIFQDFPIYQKTLNLQFQNKKNQLISMSNPKNFSQNGTHISK